MSEEEGSENILMDLMPLTVAYFLVNFGGWLWYALWGKYLVLDLGFSGSDLGLVMTLHNLFYALATLPSGKLADVMDSRWILFAGALIYAVGVFMLAFSRDFTLIALVCVLMGFGEGAFFTSATIYAVRRGGLGRAGMSYGFVSSAGLLGEVLGSLASGYLKESLGSKSLFLISFIVIVSTLLPIPLLRREHLTKLMRSKPASLIKILKDHSEFRLLAIGLIFHSIGFNAISSFFSVYAGELDLPDSGIGLVNFAWILSTFAMTMPWSFLADRFESRLILLSHVIFSSLSWLTFAHSWDFGSMIATAVVMGVVGSMDMPARRKLVAELERGYGVGTLIGSLDLITMLSAIPAPMIGGLIYQATGSRLVFWMASLINLLGIPFLLKICRISFARSDA